MKKIPFLLHAAENVETSICGGPQARYKDGAASDVFDIFRN